MCCTCAWYTEPHFTLIGQVGHVEERWSQQLTQLSGMKKPSGGLSRCVARSRLPGSSLNESLTRCGWRLWLTTLLVVHSGAHASLLPLIFSQFKTVFTHPLIRLASILILNQTNPLNILSFRTTNRIAALCVVVLVVVTHPTYIQFVATFLSACKQCEKTFAAYIVGDVRVPFYRENYCNLCIWADRHQFMGNLNPRQNHIPIKEL